MFRRSIDLPSRISLVAAIVCALLFPLRAEAAPPPYAELLIDPATGVVLHAQNPDLPTQPASLTKMMTLFLAFDSLDKGELTLDQFIPVSRRAQNMSPSKLGLVAGTSIRVEDAILGLVTRSANDAAVVLAEAIGGTEEGFAEMMTTKARIIGMRNTTFLNASGLPNARQKTTARDIATLSQALIRTHTRHYPYFSRSSFSYNGAVVRSHNRLMNRYDGMDGIKTGFVNASGFNLAATAVRDGRRLIAVVLGGRTSRERDNRVAALLDHGFGVKPLGRTVSTVEVAAVVPTVRATIKADAPRAEKAVAKAPKPATKAAPPAKAGTWAIQVGSYKSHKAGQAGLTTTAKVIPAHVKGAKSTVLKSRTGVFQARFIGMTKAAAEQACSRLESKGQDCMVVAPRG
ncbi:D-alanyl-D-alanine carboxypeptidase [Skermanella mucosa]|uniref:D-alanyl-D-alanine carboxypeptidase family protein n=1 Tax=Skermanella mucosa TaxID=1789672 RepID=UPI00192ADFE4|nr:D-alanyl-D-alanine carboxypeptidase family protein [Skermanella mucosa]UEM22194.1 D-alanyl-D-alanine carboxypeptidase [Skermanella mucosa]